MDPRTLQFVIDATEGECLRGDASLLIARVQTDSRRVAPGDLFMALKGENFDGHNFLEEVVRAGAAAILVNRGMTQKIPEGSFGVIVVEETRHALGRLGLRYRADFQICGFRTIRIQFRQLGGRVGWFFGKRPEFYFPRLPLSYETVATFVFLPPLVIALAALMVQYTAYLQSTLP